MLFPTLRTNYLEDRFRRVSDVGYRIPLLETNAITLSRVVRYFEVPFQAAFGKRSRSRYIKTV